MKNHFPLSAVACLVILLVFVNACKRSDAPPCITCGNGGTVLQNSGACSCKCVDGYAGNNCEVTTFGAYVGNLYHNSCNCGSTALTVYTSGTAGAAYFSILLNSDTLKARWDYSSYNGYFVVDTQSISGRTYTGAGGFNTNRLQFTYTEFYGGNQPNFSFDGSK